MFLSTEIFSKRRKIYSWFMKRNQSDDHLTIQSTSRAEARRISGDGRSTGGTQNTLLGCRRRPGSKQKQHWYKNIQENDAKKPEEFMICNMIFNQGIARTQSPTNKNYAPESRTFGVIANVSQAEVQWKGLGLGGQPCWSLCPLCQVSMLDLVDSGPLQLECHAQQMVFMLRESLT